ncbi:MAG: hypothetical protein LBB36_04365 [Fibromonadaceae bacterium]|jgi:hypothetical protein|nr:hypothetical protein [Fibromonadaceae bacterium]
MMTWLITFLAIAFVIAAAGAKRRVKNRYGLPPNDHALSLAILKENLLENPSEYSLQKLKDFAASQNIEIPKEKYPLGKVPSVEARTITELIFGEGYKPPSLEHDDVLFSQQATWLDSLTPLEFNEIPQTEKSLVSGILRLYSDEAVFRAFAELSQKFPSERQQKLELGYHALCELRDNSKADYDSLEKLRMEKEKWENEAKKFSTFIS